MTLDDKMWLVNIFVLVYLLLAVYQLINSIKLLKRNIRRKKRLNSIRTARTRLTDSDHWTYDPGPADKTATIKEHEAQ
jgi:predicted Holliday junction resolvase-like endonuclease